MPVVPIRHTKPQNASKAKKAHNQKPEKMDFNQVAQDLVRRSTQQDDPERRPTEDEISRVMAELGRKGGRIGGKNRAASMTPARRREIALKAARSRWDKS